MVIHIDSVIIFINCSTDDAVQLGTELAVGCERERENTLVLHAAVVIVIVGLLTTRSREDGFFPLVESPTIRDNLRAYVQFGPSTRLGLA